MKKTSATRQTLLLLIVGLVGFIIFAVFLINGQITDTVTDTGQELEGKANRIATHIEEKLHQTRERAEILALNPILQEGSSQDIADLLAKTMAISPLCEALIVVDHDGSLVAEVPEGLHYHHLNSDQLTSLLSKCELFYTDTTDEKEHYVFVSAAQVQHPEKKGRLVIALLDLNYVTETTLLGTSDEKVSLFTKDNNEIILFTPERQIKSHQVPLIANLLDPFLRQKASDYLQGTALVSKSGWTVSISRTYESFLANNARTVFSGSRFFFVLFFPVFIILLIIILAVNYSRRYFRELASRDGLTGLYNHRYFQAELHALVDSNNNRKISLLMMDLDNFKCFNDTYGHQAGDKILKKAADILLKNIRNKDIAARYGGEEFAVILSGIKIDEALKVAERIRKAVKTQCSTTVSIGVSSLPEYATTVEELIRSADSALYRAKNTSKDRVEKANLQDKTAKHIATDHFKPGQEP